MGILTRNLVVLCHLCDGTHSLTQRGLVHLPTVDVHFRLDGGTE